LLGIQSPVAVAGLLSGKGENNHTQEDVPESADTDQTKLAEQESIFLTGVLDELKIVISNSRDVSCLDINFVFCNFSLTQSVRLKYVLFVVAAFNFFLT